MEQAASRALWVYHTYNRVPTLVSYGISKRPRSCVSGKRLHKGYFGTQQVTAVLSTILYSYSWVTLICWSGGHRTFLWYMPDCMSVKILKYYKRIDMCLIRAKCGAETTRNGKALCSVRSLCADKVRTWRNHSKKSRAVNLFITPVYIVWIGLNWPIHYG